MSLQSLCLIYFNMRKKIENLLTVLRGPLVNRAICLIFKNVKDEVAMNITIEVYLLFVQTFESAFSPYPL